MENQFDFIIRHKSGSTAIIEVKNRKNLTIDDAKKLHYNIFVTRPVLSPKYFILVSQDIGYLWGSFTTQPESQEPIIFPMNRVVERYFTSKTSGLRLRNTQLEIIIYQWLNDLTLSSYKVENIEPEKSLIASGFIDWVQGAYVSKEVES